MNEVEKSRNSKWLKVLFIIMLIPFFLSYHYIKFTVNAIKQKNTKNLIISTLILITIVISGVVSINENESSAQSDLVGNSNSGKKTNIEEPTTNVSTKELEVIPKNLQIFKSDALRQNVINALESCNIIVDEVKNVEKIEDWAAGERYTFTVNSLGLVLYTNMDDSISSIRTNRLTVFLYNEGYESLNINDYTVDASISHELEQQTKNQVKSSLNYPDTAKFPLFDWSVSRFDEFYAVSGEVNAKNAFGVSEDLSYYLEYHVVENLVSLKTFIFDNVYVIGKENAINNSFMGEKLAESISNETSSEEISDDIILEYDILGQFGREITVSNYKSIGYFLSEGEYTIVNKVNNSIVMIFKIKTEINSEGREESVLVNRVSLNKFESSERIVINDDEYIALSINSKVKLVKDK